MMKNEELTMMCCSIETAYEIVDENYPDATVQVYPDRITWIQGPSVVGIYKFINRAFEIIV